MFEFEKDLLESLTEAAAHARGEKTGMRETVILVPNVKAIRECLHMSQAEFADAYQIPLATLQGWEQGRRSPDRTASAYLNVISRMPAETRAVLHP
ncbi:MAG: helix-turn-helix domain-containing protein [Asticcacaulis sp.]|nr:helix-turn-helix domain-containing protein [Asticcacaulis sp.]